MPSLISESKNKALGCATGRAKEEEFMQFKLCRKKLKQNFFKRWMPLSRN